jgi:hypothetical protein
MRRDKIAKPFTDLPPSLENYSEFCFGKRFTISIIDAIIEKE